MKDLCVFKVARVAASWKARVVAGRTRELDETDLALIDALHVNPRAAAEQLGRTLGMSAVTVARRWHRLVTNGQAWVSSAPGHAMPLVGALFEAECIPGRVEEAARALAVMPGVASVGAVSGSTDLYGLVVASEPRSLWRLLLDRLPATVGLLRTRTSVMTTLFSDANWRLRAINADQEQAMRSQRPTAGVEPRPLDDFDRAIYLALQRDGRRTHRDLAAELERSEQAVNRRMAAMTRTGLMTFRADFVRPEVGWTVQVLNRLQVAPDALVSAGRRLASMPETRVCAAVTGEANLVCTVLLHRVDDLEEWTRQIASGGKDIRVLEQQVVFRSIKSWGRLLDDDGYSTAVVPVDLWQ